MSWQLLGPTPTHIVPNGKGRLARAVLPEATLTVTTFVWLEMLIAKWQMGLNVFLATTDTLLKTTVA